ncbi:protein Aster-B-like [Culicoides brevitarsis]|uniref:protein Aster-B-like n=1 Tax=Culicoides brevitarsis TaxID=469753 RepID=UPI00307B909C
MASSTMKRSVDDLLSSSQEVLGSTLSSVNQALQQTLQRSPSPIRKTLLAASSPSSSTSTSQQQLTASPPPPKVFVKEPDGGDIFLPLSPVPLDKTDARSTTSDDSYKLSPTLPDAVSLKEGKSPKGEKEPKHSKKELTMAERAKKKNWYSVLYPSYKSRCEDFKKLFKEVPDENRLIVDYSSAIQKDILVHGRLYVSQNYLCFHANIIVYETKLVLKWKEITSIVKDKTARVIPNAISVYTENEKYFFTSFTARDKTYMMLFRVWQNALMETPMAPQELWQQVHRVYGDSLGLTSDDEDYIDPYDVNYAESGSGDISVSDAHSSKDKTTTTTTTTSSSGQHSDSMCTATDPTTTTTARKPTSLKLSGKTSAKIKVKKGELSPIEQLPTDLSDTSDSDTGTGTGTNVESSIMEQVECDSMHEGRQLVHTILPINVDNLFNLLFSKSKFLLEFHDSRRTTDFLPGEWTLNEEKAMKCRCVKLTVAINQAIGPKCSHVTETQWLRQCSREGSLYAVDIESVNEGIPYADSFSVFLHYCLSRTMDDHTVLSVHAQIKYKKSVWGVAKGFIERNTWKGLEDFFNGLLKALQSEYCIPPAKVKARRTRRGNSLQKNQHLVDPSAAHPADDAKSKSYKDSIPQYAKARTSIVTEKSAKDGFLSSKRSQEKFLSWFVISLLVVLVAVNVFLYYKLKNLESVANDLPSDYLGKLQGYDENGGNAPESHADWLKLLQQQEIHHAQEMQKWQTLLRTSIDMLKKIEDTLNSLQGLIHTTKKS